MVEEGGGANPVFIGTSGWNYPHWRGVFYPPRLPPSAWLSFYARHFLAVEVNNTFYRMPRPGPVRAWAEAVPADFIFALKVPGLITHRLKLRGVERAARSFLEALLPLGGKLGPLLLQLPPRLSPSASLLAAALRLMKEEARALGLPSLRLAVEFRDGRWLNAGIYGVLEEEGASLCLADWPWRLEGPLTASFVYVRRHGSRGGYEGSYSREELRGDARLIRSWAEGGRRVYVFFNNDAHGYAIKNARELQELL